MSSSPKRGDYASDVNVRRRTIVGATGALAGGAGALLTGCAPATPGATPERFLYGDDPSQFAELYLPAERTRPGVVVIAHGGFWRSAYGAELGRPPAEDLSRRGYICWNLEYRRVGNGGGWPQTFEDVSAGIDLLATAARKRGFELSTTTALGHSAGGHLAVWAAGRAALPEGAPGAGVPAVPLTGVVSQSGVLNLGRAFEEGLGGGAVRDLLGTDPSADPERYRLADPMTAAPLDVPVFALHGEDDSTVPRSQSESYVAAAGEQAELVIIPGDHLAMITPGTEAWERVVEAVARAGGPA